MCDSGKIVGVISDEMGLKITCVSRKLQENVFNLTFQSGRKIPQFSLLSVWKNYQKIYKIKNVAYL